MAESVRKSLLRKASMNKVLAARVSEAVKAVPNPSLLTASQRQNLIEAIQLSREADAGPVNLDKLPGFAPMQLRAQIDKVAKIHQELVIMQKQYETVLKEMGKLEKEEEKGLEILKKAAKELGTKNKYVVEAETALLSWTAAQTPKRPGVEQMITRPEDAKEGEKAGDLFGRIQAELGGHIADKVSTIYLACMEDLSHTSAVISSLKIVAKTDAIRSDVVKKAGLGDIIGGVKAWLSGHISPIMERITKFNGTVMEWVKGFTARTVIVEIACKELQKALDDATRAMAKATA